MIERMSPPNSAVLVNLKYMSIGEVIMLAALLKRRHPGPSSDINDMRKCTTTFVHEHNKETSPTTTTAKSNQPPWSHLSQGRRFEFRTLKFHKVYNI
jgi:hypothetical protein